jgi:NAD(P)-dependent dehydrogenase (short-subunit alcohol dehydrogenase family)
VINAGVTGGRADTASTVSRDAMAQLFWTNAIAPIRAGRVLLPLVREGGSIGFMTSILGSVGGRTHGYAELYSASKAALNSLSRGFAVQDVGSRAVAVLNLHPGWVKTEMGGAAATLTVQDSVAQMRRTLSRLDASHRGAFINQEGQTLPW